MIGRILTKKELLSNAIIAMVESGISSGQRKCKAVWWDFACEGDDNTLKKTAEKVSFWFHDILKVVPHKVLDNGYIQVPEGFNPMVDEHE